MALPFGSVRVRTGGTSSYPKISTVGAWPPPHSIVADPLADFRAWVNVQSTTSPTRMVSGRSTVRLLANRGSLGPLTVPIRTPSKYTFPVTVPGGLPQIDDHEKP